LMPSDTGVMPLKIHLHIRMTPILKDFDEQVDRGPLRPVLTDSLSKNASKLPTRFREEPKLISSW
jgi:hypothetical protein